MYVASMGYDVLSLPGSPIPPTTPTGKFEDVTFPVKIVAGLPEQYSNVVEAPELE